jgi:hypothetical protein
MGLLTFGLNAERDRRFCAAGPNPLPWVLELAHELGGSKTNDCRARDIDPARQRMPLSQAIVPFWSEQVSARPPISLVHTQLAMHAQLGVRQVMCGFA